MDSCAAFTEVNELPALSFLALISALLLFRYPKQTLLCLVPAALVPFAASVAVQYAALGELKLVYTEFGTESYLWEGSLWKTPLELDALNLPWFDPQGAARRGIVGESHGLYLFHMTLGHHGFWSLTPIFFFSLVGLVRLLRRSGEPMAAVAWMTAVLTIVLLAFYTWNPMARNYGGSTQGLRWLFWLIPFWLLVLPGGVETGQTAAGSAGCACWPSRSPSSRSATRCAIPGATPGSSMPLSIWVFIVFRARCSPGREVVDWRICHHIRLNSLNASVN